MHPWPLAPGQLPPQSPPDTVRSTGPQTDHPTDRPTDRPTYADKSTVPRTLEGIRGDSYWPFALAHGALALHRHPLIYTQERDSGVLDASTSKIFGEKKNPSAADARSVCGAGHLEKVSKGPAPHTLLPSAGHLEKIQSAARRCEEYVTVPVDKKKGFVDPVQPKASVWESLRDNTYTTNDFD